MNIKFLGSGSAFTIGFGNYQSNLIIESPSNRCLLIDCGGDIRFSAYEQGLSYRNFQDVYISHLHMDHVGGLDWLAFCTKFDPTCTKPNLYIHHTLVKSLWRKVLSGSLSSLQGEVANLSTYFNIHPLKDNQPLIWEGLSLYPLQVIHFMSGLNLMPTFGLRIQLNDKIILFSGDTQFTPDYLHSFYQEAHLIFHDCETSQYKSRVHAHYTDLVNLPLVIKQKMWLYHYNTLALPDAKKDGFKGFILKGQSFDLNDPHLFE